MSTFTCVSLGSRGVVYVRDVAHLGPTPRPPNEALIYTSVGVNPGELVITPVATVPVWVTVEVGPFVRRLFCDPVYDGTMVLPSGELIVTDGEGAAIDRVPFRLQPGVHWLRAQVSGRNQALRTYRATHLAAVAADVRDDEAVLEPIEHWYLTFVDADTVSAE